MNINNEYSVNPGLSEQTLLHDNSKLALRNGHDTGAENHRKKSREDEKVTHFERNYDDFKEKILVSFKDTKHDDYKARHDKGNQNRNKNYDEEPRKKDVWNDIAKNANKRNDKNENYENKANTKKEKYDDYDNLNSKASKSKESKSNNQDQKVDWEKPRKENSWDNWNSKSMEQGDTYKRGNNRDEKPKRDDDWLKQSSDWDKPKKTNDWDKPKKNNDWGKNNDDSWDQTKKRIKGIASFEDDKNDYSNKKYFNKEEKKKITNEWDRAIAKSESGRGTANKKPFVPQISNYYNPRPRIKDVPDVHGFKSFGRTSIPFVGKKGIYDDNN